MNRNVIIKRMVENLSKLPDNRLQEVSDFAEFLLQKIDDDLLTAGISKMAKQGNSYQFLEDEETLYSVSDLKERYSEKG